MAAAIIDRLRFQIAGLAMLACLAALTSCASKNSEPLIADPSARHDETALPWNQQEKWEREGEARGLTQQRR